MCQSISILQALIVDKVLVRTFFYMKIQEICQVFLLKHLTLQREQ
jgi:hypothetical protein